MLSGVFNSERAISVNISIMRTFTKMLALLLSDEVLSKRLHELEKGTNNYYVKSISSNNSPVGALFSKH